MTDRPALTAAAAETLELQKEFWSVLRMGPDLKEVIRGWSIERVNTAYLLTGGRGETRGKEKIWNLLLLWKVKKKMNIKKNFKIFWVANISIQAFINHLLYSAHVPGLNSISSEFKNVVFFFFFTKTNFLIGSLGFIQWMASQWAVLLRTPVESQ